MNWRTTFIWFLVAVCISAAFCSVAGAQKADKVPLSGWQRIEQKSALTDKITVFWSVEAEKPPDEPMLFATRAVLGIACYEGDLRTIISVFSYMGTDPRLTMRYRADDKDVRLASVQISSDGTAFGWWGGGNLQFLEDLRGSKKLAIGVTPYNKSAVEAVFLMDGYDQAFNEVVPNCK